MSTTLDLDTLELARGGHHSPEQGMCILEAVAFISGEPFSDHPECASPVIGAFLRSWNDVLDDETRQELKRYITRLPGTRADQEVEDRRAWMSLDWLVREYTPAWLRLAGLHDQAHRLASLDEFAPGMDVPSIRPAIDAVRKDAAAAWDAARAAAGAALAPTVTELRQSAHGLVDRMIEAGE